MAQTCRSCGANIEWASTVAGKRMPLRPDHQGDWVVVRPAVGLQPLALKISLAPESFRIAVNSQVISGRRFKSHFADCKDANQWRKRR